MTLKEHLYQHFPHMTRINLFISYAILNMFTLFSRKLIFLRRLTNEFIVVYARKKSQFWFL